MCITSLYLYAALLCEIQKKGGLGYSKRFQNFVDPQLNYLTLSRHDYSVSSSFSNPRQRSKIMHFDDMEKAVVKRMRLQIEKYAVAEQIPLQLIQENAFIDEVTEGMILRLSTFFLTDKKPGVTILTPKTAWGHFKQDYMPDWFTKKYPVKYLEHRVDFRVIYPEYKLSRDQLGCRYIEVLESIDEHRYL